MSKDYRHQDFEDEFDMDERKENSKHFRSEDAGRRKNMRSQTKRDNSRKEKQRAKYSAFNH